MAYSTRVLSTSSKQKRPRESLEKACPPFGCTPFAAQEPHAAHASVTCSSQARTCEVFSFEQLFRNHGGERARGTREAHEGEGSHQEVQRQRFPQRTPKTQRALRPGRCSCSDDLRRELQRLQSEGL